MTDLDALTIALLAWAGLTALAWALRRVVRPEEGSRLDAVLDVVEAVTGSVRGLVGAAAKLRGGAVSTAVRVVEELPPDTDPEPITLRPGDVACPRCGARQVTDEESWTLGPHAQQTALWRRCRVCGHTWEADRA